ncbi:MAG TPA: metallopeptidase TldD-related protein [Thermoanaerobaculia bacterium]|nr:metallopeptidase TldD-related protein [Thermoanaerobaculia bacterium]
MAEQGITRRTIIGAGAAALATVAISDLFDISAAFAKTGPSDGIGYFGRFGVTDKLVRDTIGAALSKGGDYADVFFQHRVSNYLTLEDGAVNRANANVALGVGVRVVKGNQTGYGFTEDITSDGLRRAALTAAAIAEGPAKNAPARLKIAEAKPNRYPVKVRWDDVRPQQKLAILNTLNEKTFKADGRVKKVNLQFADQGSVILVADSNGRVVEDVQPMTSLYLSCVAEQDGRRENNSVNRAARADIGYYTPQRLDTMVREAIDKTMVLFDAVQPPAGEMPVVLGAGSSGILLHEAIGHGMEADFNRKNVSIYSDKIGKPVAKPFVSIIDEGTQEAARGAINIDDEGNPVGKTMLVDKGTLTTYLHDSISAKHYGVKPTGNGRRQGYEYAPMPRMRSTYMLPGPHKKDEIIASVKNGIYCDHFSNGQVNIGAGDFTFFVKNGYLIEDGKLTKPIKDVNIIGNGPKVLELIDMVADDLKIDEGGWTCGKDGQSVPVSQGLPTVRVASITVGGRAQQKKG